MRYRTLTRDDPDSFVHLLNGCAKDGYRVVSAGASYNPIRKKFEWWAVLERNEETQQTPEAPKNETAELLEAARKIKAACQKRAYCESDGGCPFVRHPGICRVSDENPCGWDI